MTAQTSRFACGVWACAVGCFALRACALSRANLGSWDGAGRVPTVSGALREAQAQDVRRESRRWCWR